MAKRLSVNKNHLTGIQLFSDLLSRPHLLPHYKFVVFIQHKTLIDVKTARKIMVVIIFDVFCY